MGFDEARNLFLRLHQIGQHDYMIVCFGAGPRYDGGKFYVVLPMCVARSLTVEQLRAGH